MGNVPACCSSDSASDVPASHVATAVDVRESSGTAAQGISYRPVGQWNAAEVEAWIRAIGLPPEVAAAFRNADIEGDSLLSLTRKEIEEDLGVQKIGHKKRILMALDELKETHSPAHPAAASDAGLSGLLNNAAASNHVAQLGSAVEGLKTELKAQILLGSGQRSTDVVSTSTQDRSSLEETSPLTRTAQGFGLSVMESAPSRDDAVVVDGGFCTTVPVGSRVVRVNGIAVRSVDDIRTVLTEVPVGASAEIGYHLPP